MKRTILTIFVGQVGFEPETLGIRANNLIGSILMKIQKEKGRKSVKKVGPEGFKSEGDFRLPIAQP